MTIRKTQLGAVLASMMLVGAPLAAQDLDPQAAAGKLLFDETAGDIGCAACHGTDATGDIGPDILGMDPVAILAALRTVPDMGFITLTEAEVSQVAEYLRHLHELEAH